MVRFGARLMRRMRDQGRAWALVAVAGLLCATPAGAEQIVSARYVDPVERYGHFALGRPHEYARVVARTDGGRELTLELPVDQVFEDLAPRAVRLSADAPTEWLAVLSTRDGGSRLALIGLSQGRLALVASGPAIGTPNRWLNPVGVADLDGDGVAEIAAVTTPHIGGMLRVYRRRADRLEPIDALDGFSNHVYGSTELGLSMPVRLGGRMQLLVPDARRQALRSVALNGGKLVETGRCALPMPITHPDALRACEPRPGPSRRD